MSRTARACIAIFVPLLLQGTVAAADGGPALARDTLVFHVRDTVDGKGKPAWKPVASFRLIGPVASGSRLAIDYTLPSGKPWATFESEAPTLAADASQNLADIGVTFPDDKVSTVSGTFGVKIRLLNELAASDVALFQGKFTVGKVATGGSKIANDFYVDQDFRLPFMSVYLNTKDADMHHVMVSLWLRNGSADRDCKAMVYLGGKKIAEHEGPHVSTYGAENDPAFQWTAAAFYFTSIKSIDKYPSGPSIMLADNPGDYEVKVTCNGALVRSGHFTVAGGQFVDNDFSKNNQIGGDHVVFPLKVMGTYDGKWNARAWKSGIYGNPLVGYVEPGEAPAAAPAPAAAAPATPAAAAGDNSAGPTLDRASLVVRTQKQVTWRKAPKGGEQWDVWKWTPLVQARLYGPLAEGSRIFVELTGADKRPLIVLDCGGLALEEGQAANLKCGEEIEADKSLSVTGNVGFRLTAKNDAAGGPATELFAGTLTVRKFHVGNALPKFKDNNLYYVDYDWALPIGYLFYPRPRGNANGSSDYVESAPLESAMWVRYGENLDHGSYGAHLFFQGKEISNTDDSNLGFVNPEVDLATTDGASPNQWGRILFTFHNVLVFDQHADANPGVFHLNQNPGDYEIKVLHGGHLVRSAKFSVAADGKIVDNGLAAGNRLGGPRFILPVKVTGDSDGQWNRTAWKDQAFFGNPLVGFVAP